MAITVGLDFGTHQTKICIQNSDDPHHITYEFWDWGDNQFTFPSIIQINKDHTISYGHIDLSNCLMSTKRKVGRKPEEPKFPPKPKVVLEKPKEPILPKKPCEKIEVKDFSQILRVQQEKKREIEAWGKECDRLKKQYLSDFETYNSNHIKGLKELKKWEDECSRLRHKYEASINAYLSSIRPLPMVFRYFKQATFSSYRWEYDIEAKHLSVLYLANIIFQLEERFGTDFSLQMGIPASQHTYERLKPYALAYLVQAFRLVEDVFLGDYDKFLQTPYEDLLYLIPKYEYSDSLFEEYPFIIIPEAYASLISVTANGKVPDKISVMLDIGGGTTDISLFSYQYKKNIRSGTPALYHFDSVAKGLNFFLEFNLDSSQDFTLKRNMEDLSEEIFEKAHKEYKASVDNKIGSLINFLKQDLISKGYKTSAFAHVFHNCPVIYTGGGSYDSRLRKSILSTFSDVRYLDKKMLRIPHIVNEDKINIPFSILATSYGLSIQRDDDDIVISRKEDYYNNIPNKNNNPEKHVRFDVSDDK